MSQFDKLLQRIHSLDVNMRFDEVRKVLVKEDIESEESDEQNN